MPHHSRIQQLVAGWDRSIEPWTPSWECIALTTKPDRPVISITCYEIIMLKWMCEVRAGVCPGADTLSVATLGLLPGALQGEWRHCNSVRRTHTHTHTVADSLIVYLYCSTADPLIVESQIRQNKTTNDFGSLKTQLWYLMSRKSMCKWFWGSPVILDSDILTHFSQK